MIVLQFKSKKLYLCFLQFKPLCPALSSQSRWMGFVNSSLRLAPHIHRRGQFPSHRKTKFSCLVHAFFFLLDSLSVDYVTKNTGDEQLGRTDWNSRRTHPKPCRIRIREIMRCNSQSNTLTRVKVAGIYNKIKSHWNDSTTVSEREAGRVAGFDEFRIRVKHLKQASRNTSSAHVTNSDWGLQRERWNTMVNLMIGLMQSVWCVWNVSIANAIEKYTVTLN